MPDRPALPLVGRRALVAGASKGIGRAIAETLAAAGADVCLAARSTEGMDAARTAIGAGVRTMALQLEVADRAGCRAAIAEAEAAWGAVDILVLAAAGYRTAAFLDTDFADYERTLAVNLHGPVHLMQAALRGMLARGWGRIIAIASLGGRTGSPNQSAYNISKHGLIGLTRCVAAEVAARGVTVNAICPGLIETGMFDALVEGQAAAYGVAAERMGGRVLAGQPIGRLIDPAEIASLAVYLASPGAAGLTCQAMLYDGGTLPG